VNRVTLDSNVYLSGFVFGGKPKRVLEMAVDGEIEVAVSDPIIQEVRRLASSQIVTRLILPDQPRGFCSGVRSQWGWPGSHGWHWLDAAAFFSCGRRSAFYARSQLERLSASARSSLR